MLGRLRRALTEDGAQRRVRIATAMALVAMLGAVTTFRASENELIASGCARRHSVAETYFIYRKQWYANRVGENAAYVDQYKTHVSRAQRYLRDATMQLPGGGPDGAFYQVEAQIEYAAARQLQPLKDFTDVRLDNSIPFDAGLDKIADGDLRFIGLGGGCTTQARRLAKSSALALLAADTDSIRGRAIRCAFAVVFFVLALVLFTLSEAVAQRFKHACEAAGYVLAVFAVFFGMLWADSGLAVQYAVAIAIFALIAAISWQALRSIQRREASAPNPATSERSEEEVLRVEEFDTEGFRAKHLHFFTPHDRFSRTVVVLIAVAAFLSSIAGLCYSGTIAKSEHAAMVAGSHQAGIVSEYSHVAVDMEFVMREMQVGMEADLRESALQSLRYGASQPFGMRDAGPWSFESVQWLHAYDDFAEQNQQMHPYLEGADGPYFDPRYPYEMYYRREAIPPARELALADAYDEDAAIYERAATYCLFMLTVFAISLYLFGQALAMGTSNGARILAISGGVLIFIGIGAGVRTAIITQTSSGDPAAFSAACPRPTSSPAPPATRAQVAASCYAQGEYLRAIANDREEYKPAMDAYRRTVALRPQFALAQYAMLKAESEYATPQRTDYWSIEDPEILPQLVKDRKAVADALNVRDLGPPQYFVGSAAFESYALALAKGDRKLLRSSLALASSDPDLTDDATSHYNVGLMLLADARFAQGQRAYDDGLKITPADGDGDISAVSDLELLSTHCAALPWHTPESCARLAQTAGEVKARLVQHVFSKPSSDPPQAQIPRLRVSAWVAPDGVAWSAPAAQLAHVSGDVQVLWSVKDPTWNSWYVHLALMHSTAISSMVLHGDSLVDYESYLDDSNFIRCLPTRQDFRVEIYRGGELIGKADVPGRADDPDFEGGVFGAADIGFCHPKAPDGQAQWTRRVNSSGYLDGTYADPAGTFDVHAFDYFAPKQRFALAGDALELRMLKTMLFSRNTGMRPAPFNCPTPVNTFFAVRVRASTPGKAVLGEGWATPDGLLHFVVVHHAWTRGAVPDRVACEVLYSAQPVYPYMY